MPQFIMIQAYLDLGLGTDTWSDEDFIGRVSRVNRRVNTIESPIQTIKKCLIHYKMEWEKACATWAPGSSKMLPSLWRANRASRACWWEAKEGILGNSMGPQRVTYQNVRYSTNRALFVNSSTFYHVHFFLITWGSRYVSIHLMNESYLGSIGNPLFPSIPHGFRSRHRPRAGSKSHCRGAVRRGRETKRGDQTR